MNLLLRVLRALWPFRPANHPRVLNREDEAVLVRDTSQLDGTELLQVGDGKYISVADLAAMPDVMPVRDASGRPLSTEG